MLGISYQLICSRQYTEPISVQAFLYLQNRRLFPGPPSTCLLPLRRLHCFHTMYHEDGISVLRTDRSQKEPHQKNMGDEEGFQIHIWSQQSWQLVTFVQGRCPARAEQNAASQFFLPLSVVSWPDHPSSSTLSPPS